MRKTLQKILAGALILGSTFSPVGKTSADDLFRIYQTETQYNIAENPGQGTPDQEVKYEIKKKQINPEDLGPFIQEKVSEDTNNDSSKSILMIDENSNLLSFAYQNLGSMNLPESQRQKMALHDIVLEEDTPNTHIYLSLPPGVTFKTSQTFSDRRLDSKGKIVKLLPTEDTRIYEFAANLDSIYRALVKEGEEPKDPSLITLAREILSEASPDPNNAYESWLDRGISKIPGGAGISVQVTKEGIKWVLTEAEKDRQEEINRRLNTNNNLVKIPFYQPDVLNPVQFVRNNREITLEFDSSNLREDSTGYLVIEQIAFQNRSNVIPKSTRINGVIHPIDFEGIEIAESVKDLEMIAGSWKGHTGEMRNVLTIDKQGYFIQGSDKKRRIKIDEATKVDDNLIRVHIKGADDYMLFLIQDANTTHFLGDDFNRNLEMREHSRRELQETFPRVLEYGKRVRAGGLDAQVPKLFYDYDYELMLRVGTEGKRSTTQAKDISEQTSDTTHQFAPEYLPKSKTEFLEFLSGYWINGYSIEEVARAEANIVTLLKSNNASGFHFTENGKGGFFENDDTRPKISQINGFRRENTNTYKLTYDKLETPVEEHIEQTTIIISPNKRIDTGNGDNIYFYKIPEELARQYLGN